MMKKEEKKDFKPHKTHEIKKIEKKKNTLKEEKKFEKSPESICKKDSLAQNFKQIRKNRSSPSPTKKLILPMINTNPLSNTQIIKDKSFKNEVNFSTLPSTNKENPNRTIGKLSTTLAPIEEKVKRKQSVTTSKSIAPNNKNNFAALLNTNKITINNNINIIKPNKAIFTSPMKEKSIVVEKQKKINTGSVSPLRIVKMETPTEDENERIAKVRKTYKEKKLFNFEKTKSYFYVAVPGNNSALIKKCMQHRSNWKECQNSVTTLFNFKWQQNCIGLDFSSLNKVPSIKQIVNHFEYHPTISNKMNLFTNLMKYCEEKGLDLFKYIPFTIIMQYDSSNYQNQVTSFTDFFNNIKDYVMNNDKQDQKYKKYSSLFKVDQFDRMGFKTNLYIHPNLYNGKNYWLVKATDMNRGRCIKIGDSIPKILKLIKKFYDGIYKEFKECEEDDSMIIEEKDNNTKQNIKIIINKEYKNEKISKEDEEEKKEKKKLDTFKKYRTSLIILQKYIEKPLLYWKRKFDIRLWVMITHKLDVYAYREGHLKTSSEEYNVNLKDSYVHLTNYSVQKYANNFSKFEYGNEVPFSDFQNYLNHDFPNKKFNVKTHLLDKMKELITLSMKSVADKINSNNRKHCFEIFGYDFIMDADFNLYLLEINTNPGLEESSPLINKILPRMIDDALRLTIDDIFETKYSWEESNTGKEIVNTGKETVNTGKETINNNESLKKEPIKDRPYYSPFPVEGYSDAENVFCFVCSLLPEIDPKKKDKK